MRDRHSAKKVVFVGGTPFSGSTAIHLMLANDVKGFACGELDKLFCPTSESHVRRLKDCPKEAYPIWRNVLRAGKERAYVAVFDELPDVELIVDSSKNPFWIREQTRLLRNAGFEVRHLLIWKTPLEFASSWKKRRELTEWSEPWIGYHRIYATLLDDWVAVRYRDLATDPGNTLRAACGAVGVEYFEGKEEFWRKQHFHLGGNYAARVHLMSEDQAKAFDGLPGTMNKEGSYRKIYYQPVDDPQVVEEVSRQGSESKQIERISGFLESRNVFGQLGKGLNHADIRMGTLEVALRRAWRFLALTKARASYASRIRAALESDVA